MVIADSIDNNLEETVGMDKLQNENKLINYFKPFLGNNAEDVFQKRFVKDYFSTMFEKVAVVRIMYRFSTTELFRQDRVQFWDDITNFTTELGNLVYNHEGLLSYTDFNSLHAHWGYPIDHEGKTAKKMLDFAKNAIQVQTPRSILNYVILLYYGQAFVGSIGTKQNQTYLAVPDIFINLPCITRFPNGICAYNFTRESLINELGKEAEMIYEINNSETM